MAYNNMCLWLITMYILLRKIKESINLFSHQSGKKKLPETWEEPCEEPDSSYTGNHWLFRLRRDEPRDEHRTDVINSNELVYTVDWIVLGILVTHKNSSRIFEYLMCKNPWIHEVKSRLKSSQVNLVADLDCLRYSLNNWLQSVVF